MGRWNQQRAAHAAGDWMGAVFAERDANIELREAVDGLGLVRLPLDATDHDICEAADTLAERCWTVAFATTAGATLGPIEAGRRTLGAPIPERALFTTTLEQRGAMERIAQGHGVTPPNGNVCSGQYVQDGPAMARMLDPQWWRRQLRAVHAKTVEGAAIRLGYVNKKADPYVSRESVHRRAQQNERNAAALEATTATNELGQEYTLAELAATGPANKAIRRAELMTRIAGFERIALDLGHTGIFATMTCPSRMHKWTVTPNGVFENKRYDGTLPNTAQKHLARVWSRIRSKLHRLGITLYGFRIAEPNHDGTPHWHCLLFVAPEHVDTLRATVLHYALQDSGQERGALAHRVDWKPIEAGRGSAAGYIAKYVAKNIDGYKLTTDLCGGSYLEADSVTTAHRVEAWASTWRIRQFQQIGGPPVGPWRELRRVKSLPSNAPAHLIAAHDAANKAQAVTRIVNKDHDLENADALSVDWAKYVNAQGGHACGRRYAIRVEKTQREGTNKYGEPVAPIPMGVSTLERYTPEHMTTERAGKAPGWATRRLIVESARYVWTITKKVIASIGRGAIGLKAQLLAPWTCVNNCTGNTENGSEKREGQHSKRGAHGGQGMGNSPGPHKGHGRGLCPAPGGGHQGNE